MALRPASLVPSRVGILRSAPEKPTFRFALIKIHLVSNALRRDDQEAVTWQRAPQTYMHSLNGTCHNSYSGTQKRRRKIHGRQTGRA